MPQVGETKTINGVTGQWNGQTWVRMQQSDMHPASVDRPAISHPLLDLLPGLSDVLNLPSNLYKGATALPDVARHAVHDPIGTARNFVSGASEAATPGRVGMLALLTGGATAPAALAAAGGEAGAEMVRGATDAPNAATSFPQAAERVIGAASIPGVPAGFKAAAPYVQKYAPKLLSGKVTGTAGAAIGGYEGYKHDGIPGAVAGAMLGAAGGAQLKLPKSLQGLLGGASEAAESQLPEGVVSAAEGIGRSRRSAEVPGSSYREPRAREPYDSYGNHIPDPEPAPVTPTEMSPRIAGKAPTLEDSLNEVLQGLDTSDKPMRSTLPAEPGMAGTAGPSARPNSVYESQIPARPTPNETLSLDDELNQMLQGLDTEVPAPVEGRVPLGPKVKPGSVRGAAEEQLAAHPATEAFDRADQLITGEPDRWAKDLTETRQSMADAMREPASVQGLEPTDVEALAREFNDRMGLPGPEQADARRYLRHATGRWLNLP